MKHLAALGPYFWKYRRRFLLGMLFIVVSNYFAVLAPQVTGFIIDMVQLQLRGESPAQALQERDPLVSGVVRNLLQQHYSFGNLVALCGLILLVLALLRGLFMFLMRQTVIVMSRHIEYDQKNQVFAHYLTLDTHFYKTHETGDLMNRMAEDVSRVRMFTGPAVMYLINLVVLISLSVFYMLKTDAQLSMYVLLPLPILAFSIYYVNAIINRKSEAVQQKLSDLTTAAQQTYSGIRVIQSFVQEKAMTGFYEKNSEDYRKAAVSLYRTEALYFPVMALIIGISTLVVILAGGVYYIQGRIQFGDMAAFIMYLTMLTFPVSAIGWVASTIQRAAASQRRLNEFLQVKPSVVQSADSIKTTLQGEIAFKHVNFTYPHTGIHALRDVDFKIAAGEKIAIVGRTGSGKSTIAQLLLRFYDPDSGDVELDGISLRKRDLQDFRRQIGYVAQDVFLFSDTIQNNISFGGFNEAFLSPASAAQMASIAKEIESFPEGYETMVGERGVTLSGGQKQRISIARALIKNTEMLILDDCLNAVDAATEKEILEQLTGYLSNKTAIVITHRIFSWMPFDRILVMDEGSIAESGTHATLLAQKGIYADLFHRQQMAGEAK